MKTILKLLLIGRQVTQKSTLSGLEIFQSSLSIKKKLLKDFMHLLKKFLNIELELPCKGLFKS